MNGSGATRVFTGPRHCSLSSVPSSLAVRANGSEFPGTVVFEVQYTNSAGARRKARGISDSDTVQQLTPPATLSWPFHQSQFEGLAFAGCACHRCGFPVGPGSIRPPRTFPAPLAQGGKLQEPLALEPLQELPALVVLQPSGRGIRVAHLHNVPAWLLAALQRNVSSGNPNPHQSVSPVGAPVRRYL